MAMGKRILEKSWSRKIANKFPNKNAIFFAIIANFQKKYDSLSKMNQI
jgi:hypothetical protein